MADSAFWKNLGDKFRLIFDVPNGMRAKWTANEGSSHVLWEITNEATSESRIQFISLAKIAGKALDPSCQDAFKAWMLKLRERGPNSEFDRLLWDSHDGSGGFSETAYILGVIAVSASLCDEFELQAQLEEQRQKVLDKRRKNFEELIARSERSVRLQPIIPPEVMSSNPLVEPQSIGEQIDRLRDECRWTEERLASAVGFDPTTVSRHIRGEMKPSLRNLGTYERIFSTELKRKIVILKAPRKRP